MSIRRISAGRDICMSVAIKRLRSSLKELRKLEHQPSNSPNTLVRTRRIIDFCSLVPNVFEKIYSESNSLAAAYFVKEMLEFCVELSPDHRITTTFSSPFTTTFSSPLNDCLIHVVDCAGEISTKFSGPDMDSAILAAIRMAMTEVPSFSFEILYSLRLTDPTDVYKEIYKSNNSLKIFLIKWLTLNYTQLNRLGNLE